jgi:long-chain fatty acid transport protein
MKEKSVQGVRFLICSLALILAVCLINTAHATNGYFANGYSVESKAMGGAGVALPFGSLDAAVNPANMAFAGTRIDLGLSLFNPNREYTVKGNPSGFPGTFGLAPGTEKSNSRWFLIPSIGASKKLDDNNSIGISIYGNGGMNTDYDTRTFGGSDPTGVDLMQLFIVPTYARKIAAKHAVAISPIFAYQRFEAKGLEQFAALGFSDSPDNITNNGHDNSYGFGGKIGYSGEILPFLNVGASYQTRIWMSELDEYKGLFAEQGDFDIPATWTIGVAIKPIPDLVFLADVQEIYYSDVKSIHNPILPNIQTSKFGKDNGAGFGWDDITILKLGVQWQSSKEWTWRAGYSIGDQPIPASEVLANILAPGLIKQHVTGGLTKTIGNNQELKLAVMYALSNDVTGANPLEAPGQQKIKIKMNQWEFSVGYAWKF